MTSILVLKNSEFEGPAALGKLLSRDGFDVTVIDAWRTKLPDATHDMLVILGGPQSANDQHPYLQDEQRLIRDYTAHDRPVLGICLGSQLLARALGARVYGGSRPEVGFYHDLHLAGDSGPFAGFMNPFTAFHWHGETFELPKGAQRLVTSDAYQNQAFGYGSAIGVQFHLEADESAIRLWLDRSGRYLEAHSISPDTIRADINTYMEAVGENLAMFYANLKSEFCL